VGRRTRCLSSGAERAPGEVPGRRSAAGARSTPRGVGWKQRAEPRAGARALPGAQPVPAAEVGALPPTSRCPAGVQPAPRTRSLRGSEGPASVATGFWRRISCALVPATRPTVQRPARGVKPLLESSDSGSAVTVGVAPRTGSMGGVFKLAFPNGLRPNSGGSFAQRGSGCRSRRSFLVDNGDSRRS
jgi:hypothetical protein